MMDVAASRRKPNTYGKSARKVLVHDLFDVTSDSSVAAKTDRAQELESARQLRQELHAAANHAPSPPSDGDTIAIAPAPATQSASDPSLFEIDSSGDERKTLKAPAAHKRRKIVSTQSPQPAHNAADSVAANKSLLRTKVPSSTSSQHSSQERGPKSRSVTAPVSSTIKGLPRRTQKPVATEDSTKRPQVIPKSVPISNQDLRISPIRGRSPASDVSVRTSSSAKSTPKRKLSAVEDNITNISSPSQLELASLRFTPEPIKKQKAWSFDIDDSDSSSASRGPVKNRLIDRLDAANSDELSDSARSKSPKLSKHQQKTTERRKPTPASRSDDISQIRPEAERAPSSSSVPGQSRPRTTYGKQRSHLSDMLDGLEDSSQSICRQSLIERQIESLTTANPRLDFDDDDLEDDTATYKIKSIHELRQAGAVNRYDRDLDALCEELEADSRALRLQSLMQLVRMLQEQAFKRHLLESDKLKRVLALARPDLDLLSAIVLLLGIWTLVVSDASTSKVLNQIYQALLRMPPIVLTESRSVEGVAKDRTQNLSKALSRDVVAFENHILQQSVRSGQQTKHIIISKVALRCYEHAIKKLLQSGELPPAPPRRIYDTVLQRMQYHVTQLEHDDHVEHVESIRLYMSWLELSSASATLSDDRADDVQIAQLGQVVSAIMKWAQKASTTIEQSCLRLVVSLSNGDSSMCDSLASTKLMSRIFAVIESHFAKLAATAIKETELDNERLDSVILSFGCLLNLAECSAVARQRTMSTAERGKTHVDVLVDLFNKYIGDVAEAVTIDQTQVLVAFGYLSMLLCTLCLEDSIREHLKVKIKGKDLEELFKAVQTFLMHMNAVESNLDDEQSTPSTFAVRFNTVVEAVKARTPR